MKFVDPSHSMYRTRLSVPSTGELALLGGNFAPPCMPYCVKCKSSRNTIGGLGLRAYGLRFFFWVLPPPVTVYIRVLLRAIYNHIIVIIQLLLRGGSTEGLEFKGWVQQTPRSGQGHPQVGSCQVGTTIHDSCGLGFRL